MTGTIRGAVVVLEAGGVIGRGLVAAALEAGYPVQAVERSAHARAALAQLHAGSGTPGTELRLIAGSARDEADAQILTETLRTSGRPVAAVVAAVDAGRLRGRLLGQSVEATCAALSASLAPQLAAARHLLPLLAGGGRNGNFVLIGGPGGRHPWAGYGQRSLVEAALRMLARILHDEARSLGLRFQLLSVDTPTCGMDAGPPRAHWPSAFEIGQRAMQLLAPGGASGALIEFTAGEASRAAPVASSSLSSSLACPCSDAATGDLHAARALLKRVSLASPMRFSHEH